jgi:hypothetical protein
MMFFFKALAAMVAADAIDRHKREEQRRRWQMDERCTEQSRAITGRAASPADVPARRSH